MRDAAKAGVELVLLQELHNGPYFCQHESVDVFDLAETIPGPGTDRIGKLAEELKLVVVASIFEKRATGLYHNTAVVFDRSREIAGKYRKMHIPDDPGFYEKFYFTPGDHRFRADPDLGRQARRARLLGPVVSRRRAPDGAGRCRPAVLSDGDRLGSRTIPTMRRHASAMRGSPCSAAMPSPTAFPCSRAIAPATRPIRPRSAAASSSGVRASSPGPQGEFLAQAGTDGSELLICDVDMERSEHVRRIWPFLRDRRIDAYGDLTKRFRD